MEPEITPDPNTPELSEEDKERVALAVALCKIDATKDSELTRAILRLESRVSRLENKGVSES